jgi:lipopolysaccharide export system permease protein
VTTYERSVARLATGLFLSLALSLVALFLVIDFGDWLRIYTGKPPGDVALLYWFRSHVALVQFAPAAMVLVGGLTVTVIRRRGEYTALKALGASPWLILRPLLVFTLVASLGLIAFQEWVVSVSGPKIDRLMVERFDRWGDFLSVYSPRRWFRAGHWVLNVKGEVNPEQLNDVRLFEVDGAQGLKRWLEGDRLTWQSEGSWRLEGGREVQLDGAVVTASASGVIEVPLPIRPEITRLASGRPEWLPLSTLRTQLEVMSALQLPTESTRFAVHHRWAAALGALLAAVLTALLAMADRARPSIPRALISGGVLYGVLFVAAMISRSLALNSRLPPSAAAWLVPLVLLLLVVSVGRRAFRLS